jgi:hypothetical protein
LFKTPLLLKFYSQNESLKNHHMHRFLKWQKLQSKMILSSDSWCNKMQNILYSNSANVIVLGPGGSTDPIYVLRLLFHEKSQNC